MFRVVARVVMAGLLIVIVLIGGAVVLFLTIDVDHFRPQIIAKVSEATGRRVELAAIERSWDGGLGLTLTRLVIYDDPAFSREPFIAVDNVSAQLKLAPLLTRKIELASIRIDQPSIRVIKNAAGTLNVETLAPAPAVTANQSASPLAALPLLVSTFHMTDASITFEDQTMTPPRTMTVRNARAIASDITVLDGMPQATIMLDQATVALPDMAQPMHDVTLEAVMTPAAIKVRHAGAEIGQGSIQGRGIVENYRTVPVIDATVIMTRVAVQDAAPPDVTRAAQHVEGLLSGELTVRGAGRDPQALQQSLTGQASFTLEQGRVTQLNVFREALAKLSMLPRLVERLQTKLPARHQALLAREDTEIRALNLSARIERGAAHINRLDVITDAAALHGRGIAQFDGTLNVAAVIVIPSDLSTAMIRSVEELRGLADQEGAITFPLTVTGKVPQIAVRPDLAYVAQRVVMGAGQELLGDVLRRAIDRNAPAPAGQTSDAPSTTPSATPKEEMIRDVGDALLRGIFGHE